MVADDRVDRAIVGALRGQDLSAFEIWRWLGSEEGVLGRLTEAQLFPTLYRLEAEGLLQSEWQEGERTRRKYRLTSRALERADDRNWPPIAFHGERGAPVPADRAGRRPASPDPEAGSWYLPPRRVEPAAPPPTAEATGRVPTSAEAAAAEGTDRTSAHGDTDRPGRTALTAYADDLGARLDLPQTEVDRVRQEIADYLLDSSRALERDGYVGEAADAEAVARLRSPRDQALLIERAEQTQGRMSRGIRRGVFDFVSEMVLWLVLSVVVFALASGVAEIVVRVARLGGLHLTVLTSAEWTTNQMAVMLCVGAFAAGRISLGRLTRISRHGDATLRRRWAIGGAVALLAVALVLPGFEDALTVATLLVVPIAFVAGTLRPQHKNERAYSLRGVLAVLALVAIVTLLPGARMFAYDPNGTPGAALAQGRDSIELSVTQPTEGTYNYEVPGPAATGIVSVELWPATTSGPFIVVDPSATGPTLKNAQGVNFAKLPQVKQWWVVAVATGPNGERTVLAMAIQTGASPSPSSALGWLLSHL